MIENEIYEKNINFIQKYSAEIYNNIYSSKKIRGKVFFSNDIRNPQLKYCNQSIFMHSQYNIKREFDNMFKNVNRNVTTLILFGIASLEVLEYIKSNFIEINHLILIEPHAEVIKNILRERPINEIFGLFDKFSLIVNEPQKRAGRKVENLLLNTAYSEQIVAVTGLFAYQTVYADYLQEIIQSSLRTLRIHRVNKKTLEVFRTLWLVNFWKNIKFLLLKVVDFKSLFQDKPLIIVSAGPSLEKQIEQLRVLQDKAIILAVGSSIRILETHGIVPTFRMAIDATKENELLFDSIDTSACPIIYSDHLYFPIVENYKGDKLHISLPSNPLAQFVHQKIGSNLNVRSGFSVANTALDFGLKMGSNPIVLVGQDLCYTEGKLHASGSWDDELGEKYIKKEIETVNVNGEKVYTDRTFLGMKKIFEYMVEERSNIDIINATEGGLSIEGMRHIPFQDVIQEKLNTQYEFKKEYAELRKIAMENSNCKEGMIKEVVDELYEMNEELIGINSEIISNIHDTYRLFNAENKESSVNKKLRGIRKLYVKLKKNILYKEVLYKIFSDTFGTRKAILEKRSLKNGIDIDSDLKILLANAVELEEYLTIFKELVKEYRGGRTINIVFEE